MADPWPPSLPQIPLRAGYRNTEKDSTISSSMGYGPAKKRARTIASIRNVNASFWLTQAQVNTLETFYRDYKALTFSWINHLDGSAALYRFTSPPSYEPMGGQYFNTKLTLEIIPA